MSRIDKAFEALASATSSSAPAEHFRLSEYGRETADTPSSNGVAATVIPDAAGATPDPSLPSPTFASEGGVLAAGEMAVIILDADISKAYNYAIATSSGGNVYMICPFTNYTNHHIPTTRALSVTYRCNHAPWLK